MNGISFYFEWEAGLMIFLQQFMNEFTKYIAMFFTLFGEEFFLIGLMGYLYWCHDKKLGIKIGTNIAVGIVLNPMIKNVFIRRRPYFDIDEVKCYKPVNAKADIYDIEAQGYSFPSGHSTNVAAMFVSLIHYIKKRKIQALSIVIIILTGSSRMLLGNHYPTDVLIGWLLGIIVALGVSYVQDKVQNKKFIYIIIVLIALVGCVYCRTNDYFSGVGIMIGIFSGDIFEEKYVNFTETKNPVIALIRVIGGGILFVSINYLLKMIFGNDIFHTTVLVYNLMRVIRYSIVSFILVGIYPISFRKIK